MSDNLWRRIEAKIRPVYIIALILLLILWGFAQEAKADVSVELGAGLLSGEYSSGQSLYIHERFDSRYSVGMGYISKQWVEPRKEPRTAVRENLCFQGLRHVTIYKGFEAGLGAAYCNATNRALGSKLNAALELRYNMGKFHVTLRHYSNAGSQRPNMGQDMLLIGYTF